MGIYRVSRNHEGSIIQYLKTELEASWSNIQVEKTFARIYDLDLPSVCIHLETTNFTKAEIGDNALNRKPVVIIDIFATSDGQRLDIKDFIIEKIKEGCTYYEYEIENGAIKSKTANGRIRVIDIIDKPVDFEIIKSELDVHDRFRHSLVLTVSRGKIE